ncbi:DUF3619 family protein [Pandoraea apista]|uniref:DUF3619 family protein n=1 Tax=Pandoraea apista TaxID=93218 RepID=A0A0B5FHV6_9BURK|nr:DUF3619 family protein [Pandoraea apista]AJF00327.1 membrane protein [Pandoraea apista]AKH74496.1 membrane protein [Pandoraea apista]AKI63046.1 membrane protein [Pandoraea apista]ALS64717.1 hypothetical protein AT395_06730 [Pandoraea apista]AVF41300.1 DUF3619 domain-containing protein [Pandoraea apista]
MSHDLETREIRFANRVRRALDEASDTPSPNIAARLAAARQEALARKKPEPVAVVQPALVLAGVGAVHSPDIGGPRRAFDKLGRLGLLWPLAALVIGLAGIAYWEHRQHIQDLADIDAAVLSDELPLSAYADHGFNAYLKRAQ